MLGSSGDEGTGRGCSEGPSVGVVENAELDVEASLEEGAVGKRPSSMFSIVCSTERVFLRSSSMVFSDIWGNHSSTC